MTASNYNFHIFIFNGTHTIKVLAKRQGAYQSAHQLSKVEYTNTIDLFCDIVNGATQKILIDIFHFHQLS